MRFGIKKFLLIIVGLGFIGLAFFYGGINLQFGKNNSNIFSKKYTISSVSNIKNITGYMYISPNNSFGPRIQEIGQTKARLWIQTYEFTHKDIKALFKKLANQSGMDIKIIVEDKKYQQYQNTLKTLQTYFSGYQNIQIKSDKQMGTEYVHSKINISDSGFWIQTANLTHSSFEKNREYLFYSLNSDILASLSNIFIKDRNGEAITQKDIHPNLLICNINCRAVIEHFLKNANNSIIIQTQYITDPSVQDILKKKIDENKEVRMVLANTDDNIEFSKYLGPIHARLFDKYYNHAKMILVDKKYLILGSMNLSSNSLDKNREIGIVLTDPSILNQFLSQFENDRKLSKGKW